MTTKREEALHIINNLSEAKLDKALHYLYPLWGPTKRSEVRIHGIPKPKKKSGDNSPGHK